MSAGKKTAQRRWILDAVRALDSHPTAEQVFEYLSRRRPSIGKATVYRNLRRMAESGELLNAGGFSGSAHYDHNLSEHYHFTCDSCGRIFDIDGDFSDLPKRIFGADDFDVTSCNVSFAGLCGKCKAGALTEAGATTLAGATALADDQGRN